jgi:hypothetical protein
MHNKSSRKEAQERTERIRSDQTRRLTRVGDDGDGARAVTSGRTPPEDGAGAVRALTHLPCFTFHTKNFSKAPTNNSLPDLS